MLRVRSKRRFILGACCTLLGSFSIGIAIVTNHQRNIAVEKQEFVTELKLRSENTFNKIQNFLDPIYEAARTISLLPGVRRMSRQNKSLDINTSSAIQQIYNNAFSNSHLSEIYILPARLEPDTINPNTKKPDEPLMTFDSFITNKTLSDHVTRSGREKSELPEVEIFEYRQMKEQLAYLERHFKTNREIESIKVPYLISQEIITCDNAEFTKKQLESGDDTARLGYVVTVPRFDLNGSFTGGVSVVFRSKFLLDLLPNEGIGIIRPDRQSFIKTGEPDAVWSQFARELSESEMSIQVPMANQLVYSEIKPITVGEIRFPFYLVSAVSLDSFWSNSSATDLKNRTGTYFILLILCTVIALYSQWQAFHFSTTLEDKVEKRTEELTKTLKELKESQAQLIQSSKMASLGEMAGGIAHEVNNPMAIISGFATRILKELEHPQPERAQLTTFAHKILSTTERVTKIVRGLRAFARQEKGESCEIIPLDRLIDDTLDLCSIKLKNGHVTVRREIPEVIKICCQPIALSQVLLNLINNAADAIETLSERWITIEATQTSQGEIPTIEIRITDSGTGLPSELKEKFFQPFFTTKPTGKGTGLGLSISKGIIDQHEGEIFVDATTKNTSFVIRLPQKQDRSCAA